MAARPSFFLATLIVGLAVAPSACHQTMSCTHELRWSITVSVRDATTGEEICDAAAIARDGNFQDDLFCWGPPTCSCAGVSERLGSYQVTVSAPGYHSSTKTVVVADSDECHVETEHADFALNRL